MKKNIVSDALTPSNGDLRNDQMYAWLRSFSGAVPGIGGAIAEYLSGRQPDWKFERLRSVVICLDRRVAAIENGPERFSVNIKTSAGADLLQEGMEQAARAITDFRQEILGRVIANSLTREEIEHEQDYLVFSTLRSLSEYELIHFIYQATMNTREFEFDAEKFQQQHKDILDVRTSELNSSPETLKSTTTQRQYKALLAQKGLLDYATTGTASPSYRLSGFGRLFFRSLDIEDR